MTVPVLDTELLGEAADWLIRFQCGDDGEQARCAFERWRGQSALHAAAWRRAEAVLGTFGQVPAAIGHGTLQQLDQPDRRQALRALGALLVIGPAGWLAWRQVPWQDWRADIRTATGEQKTLELADGTRLVLNTASAADIVFTAGERRIRLHAGEVLIRTGRDPSPRYRPFIVQTPQGTARALGTRFLVRLDRDSTRVAVFDGAVEIVSGAAASGVAASGAATSGVAASGAATPLTLQAGQQTAFSSTTIERAAPADPSAALWEQGMLVVTDMRLGELVAELGRYRVGLLRCDPRVAALRVSGAFPLRDTDASLQLLWKTLPLRVRNVTRYWVSIEPA